MKNRGQAFTTRSLRGAQTDRSILNANATNGRFLKKNKTY